ncbi:hypothetical protein FOCC_FOCC017538 [Frankliniella occidentalis]|nr:hypothetical protein FOCC_FOCC017538 [Frankliniella occidentalis]
MHGRTALHIAVLSGQASLVRARLEDGDLDAQDDAGWTALHHAAEKGEVSIVDLLLEAGARTDVRGHQRFTPLHVAATNGHTRTVRLLLEAGARTNVLDHQRFTPLHVAATKGHTSIVRLLLEAGARSDLLEENGVSPLDCAAYSDRGDTVRLLLRPPPPIAPPPIARCYSAARSAADLDSEEAFAVVMEELRERGALGECQGARELVLRVAESERALAVDMLYRSWPEAVHLELDERRSTALIVAARLGHLETVQKLVEVGANKDARDADGKTPFRHADCEGHGDVRRWLLGAGIDCWDAAWWVVEVAGPGEVFSELLDELGRRGVLRDCPAGRHVARLVAGDREESNTRELLDRWPEAVTLELDEEGSTMLHIAAGRGHDGQVRTLLGRGADLLQQDRMTWTALHHATRAGSRAFVPPLCVAARYGHREAVERLVDLGADKNAGPVDREERLHYAAEQSRHTPLQLAAEGGDLATVAWLLRDGADCWDAASWAAAHGRDQEFSDFIQEIERRGELQDCPKGRDVLCGVAEGGSAAVTSVLLSHWPEAVDLTLDIDNSTLLHINAARGHVDAARRLLEAGARHDVQAYSGRTPLYHAAQRGHGDTVRMLLEAGAQRDVPGNDGWTPLHLAAQGGHVDTARLLLKYGAQCDAQTNNGWIPLHLAAWRGHVDTARLLLEYGAQRDARPYSSAPGQARVSVIDVLWEHTERTLARSAELLRRLSERAGYTEVGREALGELVRLLRLWEGRGERRPPLGEAAHRGDLEAVRRLVELGADRDALDAEGRTPAQLAAKEGHTEVAEWLGGNN